MSYALILSDGKPGHENQSKALAEGLGLPFKIIPCIYPSRLYKALSYGFDAIRRYPDLTRCDDSIKHATAIERPSFLIGTGSNTFLSLKRLKHKLRIPCAAILMPRGYRLNDFDVILAPAFDLPPNRENIKPIPTNLTPVRPDFYSEQTHAFFLRYTPKCRRAVGVIIGGRNAFADVSPSWLENRLKEIFAATANYEHWVTTSRRTSPEAEAILSQFPFDYTLRFSQDHFNPIPAFVTQCEHIFVTAESTGMLSEVVANGTSAVEILDNLPPNAGKFSRFIEELCTNRYAHRFDGSLGNARKKVNLSPLFSSIREQFGF